MAHKEWEALTTAAPTMNRGTALCLASFCGWEPNSTEDTIFESDPNLLGSEAHSKDAGWAIGDSVIFDGWMDAASHKVLLPTARPDDEPKSNIFSASIVFNGNIPEFPVVFGNISGGHPDALGISLFLTPLMTPPQFFGISGYCPYRSPRGDLYA